MKETFYRVDMFDVYGKILGQSMHFTKKEETEHWVDVHIPNTRNISYYDVVTLERTSVVYVADDDDNPNPV